MVKWFSCFGVYSCLIYRSFSRNLSISGVLSWPCVASGGAFGTIFTMLRGGPEVSDLLVNYGRLE